MSIRIESYDGGDALYVAIDPDGTWARSAFPDELVTIDCNARGKIIGVELRGSAARAGVQGVFGALLSKDVLHENTAIVEDALHPLFDEQAA